MPSRLLNSQQKFPHWWTIASLLVSLSILLSSGSARALGLTFLAAQPPTQPSDDPEVQTEPSDRDPTAKDDTTTPNPDSQTANQPRFSCELNRGNYTVMYHPQTQPGQSYPWAIPSGMGGGWSPERRCNEISRRLESYRPDGLVELRTNVENGYNVICVTTEKNSDCRIVLTVPAGEDPNLTRDRVFQNLTVADSGQSTQGVNTFAPGEDTQLLEKVLGINRPSPGTQRSNRMRDSIYLKPFLDRLDGGTGTQLRSRIPNQPNPRLNPDRFRN